MLDAETVEKAKHVQLGLQQFEKLHAPEKNNDGDFMCGMCAVDYPCDRMLLFMLLQGIASFSAMIPTGNMANVMSRFMGGKP